MENKSNSLNRIKRQQREKVLRFSIRKYSFGAASVAVAALMFLGARVASADSVLPNAPQSNAGVVNPKDKVDSPVDVAESTENKVDAENQALTNTAPSASTVDKAKLKKVVEELNVLLSTKLNLDESVVSPVKDRLQKGKEALESSELAQKDIDELVELLSKDVTVVSAAKEVTEVQVDKQADKTEKPADNLASQTSPEVSASEESQTVSAKKDTLKVSVDQLQAAVLELPEHETSKEVLEKANELLGLAQGVLENTTVSLNDVEDMTKRVKRMFNSVKNATTRLTSGARDSRNGKSMGQGTNFRANGEINQGALTNVKYFASVDPKDNGGRKTINDNPEFTRNKTDIKAYYMKDSEGQWIVYDVFFNNDGKKMTRFSYQQEYYFQGPFNIMDLTSDGLYKPNTVKDLYFTRYAPKDPNAGKKLSDGFDAFKPYGNTANISKFWDQNYDIFNADKRTIYDPRSGVYRNNQRWDVFKYNQDDPTLNTLTKNKNGGYPGASYYLGLKVGSESTDYAVHMHAKIKIRDNVTPQEAAQYGRVYAATTTKGDTTKQSYIMGATGSRLQNDPEAPKDPIKGLTVTKTVGDDAGDPINPVSSGYVTHKNGKSFPAGMNWTWKDNKSPSTAEAGVFKYKSIATYKDGSSSEDKNSGSDGTVTLNVKPKQPIITPNLEHKKGLPNQQITVNVGNRVPNNSKVNIYDGDRIIGTGTTNGQTATVTVKEPLPGKPLKAETVVTNANGTVTSDRSNPVTPTPKPDTQAPTLTVTPLEQVVKVGEKIKFNVDGRDDTKVNLDFSDIFTKYPNHLFTQKTNYSVNTDKQKTLSIDLGEAKESDIGEKTVTVKATDDAGHKIEKTVKVKVIPATKENEKHNPTAETVVVGIKQELTDEAIKAKVKNYPSNATLTVKQKPDTDTTGNKTATVIVTYSDKSTDEVTVPVVVRDTTPPKIYWVKDDGSKVELGKTHAEGQNIVIPLYRGDAVNTRLITTDDSGKVTNFKTENLQSGFSFTPVNGTATEGSPLGQSVTGTVGLGVGKGKYTARAISTDGTNTTTGYFVFEVHEQAEKYTPAANTLTVPFNHKITDDEVKGKVIAKPGTPAFPAGTIFEVVSKPETNTTGTDKKAVVKITYPDKSTENIDVPVHVGKDLASQHPLEGQTVTVTVGDSLKTWKGRVDSNQYTNAPKGRGNGVEWGWKGTTPKALQDTAGVFKYTATATHTDKSVAESNPQVTVIVKPKAPTIETDLTGKAELPNTAVVVNVHNGVKDGSIVTLYSQDGRAIGTGTVANGKATITGTIPKGNITAKTTVRTPGEQDVTSDPSPEKVATTNKAALYPIKGKTATVTVGDSLRQWNRRVDANQYTDAGPNGKGIGVEWGWEGTAPKILQDTAGVFKYTATATHTDKTVAKSNPQVTIIVKPKAPTIETDLTGKSNQENVPVTVSVGGGVKDGSTVTLYGPDGTTVIGTGTVTNGKATAIITGKVPVGNITAKTTVQTPGQDDVVSEPSPIKEATNIAPTAKTQTVGLNEKPNAKNSIGNNGDLPNGTNYTWKTTPDTSTPGDKPGVVTVTYPDGSTIDVPVTVKVTQVSDDYTPKYEDGSGKPGSKVEIPLKEENDKKIPDGTTFESDQPGVITVDDKGKVTVTIPKEANPGDKITGKVTVTYPDGSKDEVPVNVTVTNRDKDDYTPKYNDGRGKPGSKVEIPLTEENGKKIPDGTTFESDQPGVITVDDKGKVTVTIPKEANPGDKITGKVTVTYPDGSKDEVPVNVTVTNRDKDDYTPKYNDGRGKPGSKVEIPLTEENGKKIPDGTTFESDQPGVITVDDKGKVTVTIPKEANPGDKITGKVTVTYPDGSKDEVPVNVTVTNRDKDDYTPKYNDGRGKPGSNVEIPLKEENGKKIPDGTTFESDQPGVITVDDKGKVTVTIPKEANPGDKITGKVTVTYPDGSKDEVPVNVTVTNRDKDDYTPKYNDGRGKPGSKVEIPLTEENGKKIPDGTTFESDQPGVITVDDKGKVTVTIPKEANPGDKITGKVTVTYPDGSKDEVPVNVTVTNRDKDDYTPKYNDGRGKPGSKVEIPLTEENGKDIPTGTTFESDQPGVITVDDKGKVTVTIPKEANPGDKITGKVTVTYPDGSKDEVPVNVTVTNRDKDDYTPKYNDGRGKPGSNVEIPLKEENGKKIPDGTTFESDQPGVITVDDKGKVTVTIPKEANPGDKITGKVTVTYPDGSKDEVPVNVTVTNRDKDDYTPKYNDGRGKPGSNVEIPLKEENGKKIPDGTTFESDQPGVITVDDKGKVTVTIPKEANPGDKITGKVTVTYPDGSKDEVPVNVTVTNRDKDDYTPKYEDGNGKPGSKVEIPLTEENGKDIPTGTTFESDQPGVITVDDKGKVTVTIPKEANPGDKITGKVTVTYPDGSKDEVPVNVTVVEKDKGIYTPKYEDGNGKPGSKVEIPLTEENGKDIPTGTTFESDQPGVITVDDKGKVTVTIPKEANPGDKITGKVTVTYPDGSKDEVPVNVTVVEKDKGIYTPKYNDGRGKPGSKVEIPLTEENGKDIPTGTTFESDQPGVITVDDKGKVTVTIPKEANPGDKITGKVTVTYPDGSKDEVPVNVTVTNRDKDEYTPKYEDETGKPGSKVEIPLTEENGKKIPDGTTFESDQPGVITVDDKGKVTVTIPKEAKPGDKITGKVTVTYPDGSKEEIPVTVTVGEQDKDIYTPKYEDGNGKPGSKVEIPLTEENGKKIPDGTTFESDQPGVITVDDKGKVTVTIPKEAKPGDKITGKVTVTYPDGSKEEIPVTVTVGEQDKDIYTPKYEDETGKPGSKVEIPLTEENGKDIPTGTTFESDQPGVITVDDKGKVTVTIPKEANPGDKITGKVTVTYPDGSKDEVPVNVTVTNRDKDEYTPKYEDETGKPGSKVEIPLTEENGKKIPDGTTFESDQPGVITVDDKGKVTVTIPKEAKPGDKITGKVTVTYPDGSKEEIPVTVTVGEQDKDIYTPKYEDGNGKPGSKVEIPLTEENGKDIPTGTTFESDQPGVITVDDKGKVTVTIPKEAKPGDKITGKITVTYPDGSTEEVPVNVTVTNRDKDDYAPKYEDGSGKPGSKVEIPLKEENGKDIPAKTTYVSDQPGVIDVDDKGKVTVTIPKDKNPGDKITGKITVTYPDGSTEEVPVNVTVTPATPETEKPGKIEITRKPNGDAVVTPKKPDGSTFPPGTKVEIPGENGPITVEIGQDGKGKVPNDKLPKKDVPGTGKITEPGKPAVEVPNVTTPAHQTPTLDVEQDPKTGDVTVTPKRPDGSTFPPGTKVEIPGENGPITVEIGQDGKGKVPNDKLPKKDVPGTGKITEPGKPAVEVPNVTTPAHQTPTLDVEQDPKTGDVTVTPKRPDGSTFPPGTKVEIPGENGPITVEIGQDGKGKVPNDKLPKKDVPGTGKITEPGKPAVEVPNVTTPAHQTPTLDVEQDPKTGDVTVTPKRPDGSTFPPGTKVEIPGENGPITVEIGQDGKGKVPNDKLPKKDVPGTGKITEPGKPAVEVPNVTTPAHQTPTLDVEQDPKTGDVTVTPKRPDGSTFPPGTKVEIPGENGPITVEIGQDGKGKVPNDKLPKKDVPGTGKITEPGKPAVEVPNVTTPAHQTPTLDVEQDPKTGDVTVTPKKPDGSTFPPGTKVEIPGENGPITVEIGQDGKGKVPNDKLPKKDVPGTGKITEPGKPAVEVPNVTTPAHQTPTLDVEQDPKTGDVTVTPKRPDGSTFPPGTKVEIPGENGPITVEIGQDGKGKVPNDKLPKKDVPGTGKITEPGKPAVEVPNVTTPAHQTPTLDVEQDPKTGDVTVTPKRPDGSTFPPGTKVEIPGENGPITVEIGQDGKGKVPNDKLPKKDVPGTGKITEPGKPAVEVPNVTTPAHQTPTLDVEQDPKTGDVTVTPKRPDGSTFPPGTKVEIPGENGPITVEIGQDGKGKVPNDKLPKKDVPGTGKITEPGKPAVEVPNVTTPAHQTPTLDVEQDPKTGDVTVTPKRPDGSTFPPGTKVEIPGENGPITVEIGQDGKGKVPNDKLPKKDVPGTGKITEPGKPAVEVPNVTTPAHQTPTLDVEQDPKTGDVTVTPKRPDGSTFPPGTKVEIPGENGPITVEIGQDGKGKVPNDKLPKKDVPGTGKITEPGKPAVEVPNVTTPAHQTPTLDVEQDPKTGDVTVTPKKPDGSTYPPGTKVEIPGKDGNPITVTIGEDGKGKVPNSELPDGKVPGTAKITEPGQPTVEVPVETPAKVTPETPTTEKPGKIEITQQPNGNAIVTPKKPDGSTYPPGTKVEIPGENGTTIIVTIGDNGSGEVPNDKLPKGNVPGTGTVTEPNKKPSQPVDVTTPARKTPKVELEQDPKTGDVTVTPKKPDGSTYPPGTKVEIPGKDGNPITVTIGEDGKGKVPNSELPEGKVPGTAKITEPGQPTVEVPDVTTPGKVTPSTPTDTNPVAPVTPDMPVKPDTNGNSGQDKPAPATPTPNADQVDTKTTVDNGAKSNDSQNVLPNTGTESNAALASLGLLGLLSGFGLVARKKKED